MIKMRWVKEGEDGYKATTVGIKRDKRRGLTSVSQNANCFRLVVICTSTVINCYF